MLAGRLWSKVLAEELGAGRERGGPGRAGSGRRLSARGWRLGTVARAGWGAGEPRAVQSCTPGSPGRAREVPASKLETSTQGAASRPAQERLFALTGFLLLGYPTPDAGLEGGTTRPGVKCLGGAEGAVAGRDRAPAAPCADPGESAPRREARALGYRERATPPPRLPLGSRRTPASPSPRLRGASGIVRFGVTPGDLSPRLGGRGASLNLAG